MPRTIPRKSPRHRGCTISKPPPAAMMAPATMRTLRDSVALITGAVVADLVMSQGKTFNKAPEITGFPVVQLRAYGIEFAMGLVRQLDPELEALMDADTPETEAAQVASIAANARVTAHVPGTII